jgi:DNA repair exonuclease SbcCD nuclease subunit
VFVVPGNHERGRLPACLRRYAGVHVVDRPRTFVAEVRGVRVALAGFPYERKSVRTRLPRLLRETAWAAARADVALLCIHHCVEGATVGPGDFTFTSASDVIRGRDIPAAFTAVLSGHIHRRQVLTRDLRGRPLPAPVLYPGSVERTSSAEIGEPKGYLMVQVSAGSQVRWEERPLPARPMLVRTSALDRLGAGAVESRIRAAIDGAPADAVLRLRLEGQATGEAAGLLSAATLRAMAPSTMNVEVSDPARRRGRTQQVRARGARPQLAFDLD